MNLNFYNPNNLGNLQDLQNNLQEQINKLNDLKNLNINQPSQVVQQPLQPQRYYLDCGNKEDWNEFLKINYNLTERQIFDDYKLFLQAKAELSEDTNKEKLEEMKQKLQPRRKEKGNDTTQYVSESNVQQHVYQQQVPNANIQQPIQPNQFEYLQQQNVQPIQQMPMQVPVNASNISVNNNQHANRFNENKLAKNTNSNENKGGQHAR